jgi:small subunit ribosomal protein S5
MATRKKRNKDKDSYQQPENIERTVCIRRTSKAVIGGRDFCFSAVVVVGEGNGRIGYGQGKSKEVPVAIKKAIDFASQDMSSSSNKVELIPETKTIGYKVVSDHCASKVLMMPASEGTGIIAGNAMRAVFECLGVENIVAKSIGSSNPMNVVKATIKGLLAMRTAKQVSQIRGKKVYNKLNANKGEAA